LILPSVELISHTARIHGMGYLDSLKDGHTLEAFIGDGLVFSSSGKWLHPLFDLEAHIRESGLDPAKISLHDTVNGTAAAALIARLGIRDVNVNLISDGAIELYEKYGVHCSYSNRVGRILCKTEALFSPDDDLDCVYVSLRRRAGRTMGIEVSIDALSFSYPGGKRIFDSASLLIERGESVVLRGDNGSGKTTLLRILLGLEKGYGGKVLFDGAEERMGICYIKQFQDKLNFPFSVREAVSLSALKTGDRGKAVSDALERVGAIGLIDRNYFSLSGGEAERVNLARALASKAKLLLLDEPTASLDSESREMFAKTLNSLSVEEMPTILLVTHDSVLSDELPLWRKIRIEDGKFV